MLLKEVFVALGLEVDEAAFAKGQLAASLVEAGMRKIVEIGKEAVQAFIENTKEAIEYGDHIRKTSQSIGIAVESLQELQYAGAMSGVSAEEMSGAINILTRNMNAAKGGAEEQGKAFSKLGIKVKDSSGHLRGADEVMTEIADKLSDMPDGAEKTALAMQFFGKSGAHLIPMLNEGADGLAELREEAREMGLVMSDDSTKAAEQLGDNLERLHNLSKGLWRQAIAPLLPDLNKLVEQFLKWRRANSELIAGKIREFLGTVLKTVRWLGGAMKFLIDNAEALKVVLGVAGLTTTIVGLAGWMTKLGVAGVWAAVKTAAAWALAAAPFIAIGALIAGFMLVFDDIRTYQEGGDSLYGRFKKEIDSWLEPKSEDSWFVSSLKYFLRLMKEAIEVLLQFNDLTNMTDENRGKTLKEIDRRSGLNKGQQSAQTDRIQLETARTQARAGVPLSDASKAALQRTGVSEEAFRKQYTPTAPAVPVTPSVGAPSVPVPTAGAAGVSAPMQFSITQQPGESGEGLAQRIGQVVETVLQGKISAAVAGVRGGG